MLKLERKIIKNILKKRSRIKQWKEIDKNEMKNFLALILNMVLERKGKLQNHWTATPCFPTYFPGVMGIRRSELIDIFLQINSIRLENEKSIGKLEPLLDLFENFNNV